MYTERMHISWKEDGKANKIERVPGTSTLLFEHPVNNVQKFSNAVVIGDLIEIKKFLSDKRLYSRSYLGMAFRRASREGYVDVVAWLLKEGSFNPGDDASYILRKAVLNGHVEVVELLLEDGRVNVKDVKDKDRHIAGPKRDKIVELLKKYGK